LRKRRRVAQHPSEFRRQAVERIRAGQSVLAVSRDIGVHYSLLYKWLRKADAAEHRSKSGSVDAYVALRDELRQVKELLADKTLEVDFFKGALQKVEARRRLQEKAGERASTPNSGR
jgi:transposase-like protein